LRLTKTAALALLTFSTLPLVGAQEVTISEYLTSMVWTYALLVLTFTLASLLGFYLLVSSRTVTRRQLLLVFVLLTIFLSLLVWSGGQLLNFMEHSKSAAFLPRNQTEGADVYYDRLTAAVIQRLENQTIFESTLIGRFNTDSTAIPLGPCWFSLFTGLVLAFVAVWMMEGRHFHIHWLLPAWIGYALVFFDATRIPTLFGLVLAGTLILYVPFVLRSYLHIRLNRATQMINRIRIFRRLRLRRRPAEPTALVGEPLPSAPPITPRRCQNCGTEVESFTRYCHKCGAPLTSTL
jgi:hypothetical protein